MPTSQSAKSNNKKIEKMAKNSSWLLLLAFSQKGNH